MNKYEQAIKAGHKILCSFGEDDSISRQIRADAEALYEKRIILPPGTMRLVTQKIRRGDL